MQNEIALNPKNARIAGLLYFVVFVTGIFSQFFIRSKFVIEGDTAVTIQNISAHLWEFRLAFVSDIICQTAHFFLALMLYFMFKTVHRLSAMFLLASVLVSVSITFLNMLNHFAVILLLSGASYMSAFSQDQVNALVMFFLDLHKYGYSIPGVFFGLWLFPLGYLVYVSNRFPKIIGLLLMVSCFGYLIDFVVKFMFPDHMTWTYPGLAIAVLGELSICFYLLIKGPKN
ncbi:MAG: DUF4386 domain-containing protein [Cytophagales bacterium]|nr:DUF4386 domain-containing protein [Cytophagales bacterium]